MFEFRFCYLQNSSTLFYYLFCILFEENSNFCWTVSCGIVIKPMNALGAKQKNVFVLN